MRITALIVILGGLSAGLFVLGADLLPASVLRASAASTVTEPLRCIAFSSYVDGYNPNTGPHPPPSLIDALLDVVVKQTGFRCILTYGMLNGLDYTFEAARNKGVKVIAIIWLDTDVAVNAQSITLGIQKAKQYPDTIIRLSCGSEVRTRRGKSTAEPIITNCINLLRTNGVTQPLTSIDTWWSWCNETPPCAQWSLAANVDWIGINVYPWWENKYSGLFPCTTASQAGNFHIARLMDVSARYSNTQVILTEFGWPAGPLGYSETNQFTGQRCGIASEDNQRLVITDTLSRLDQLGLPGVLFEAFRETWKTSEGPVGPFWGICDGTSPYTCKFPGGMTTTLASGWNLISLPISPTTGYTAESLATEINAQGGNCNEVDRWLNGGWDSHVKGLPFNNFAINLGAGYFVKCTQSSIWSIQGTPIIQAIPLNLYVGWNLVAVPYAPVSLTAESMLSEIGAQGGNCSEVDRWLNGGWDSHVKGLPFNNFSIDAGKGYFVKCAAQSTYTPGGVTQQSSIVSTTPLPSEPTKDKNKIPAISQIKIANIRDNTFSVSWVTSEPSHGWIRFGTTVALDIIGYDDRGAEITSNTHHVTVGNLQPNTTYYFDLLSDGTIESNNGAHHRMTTGPTVGLPGSDVIYGKVFKPDGKTPAEGALVYVNVIDKDGRDSVGTSALLSAIVDRNGYWHANLGNLRENSLAGYFVYSARGDSIAIEVEGAVDGRIGQEIDTSGHAPVPPLILLGPRQFNVYLPFLSQSKK